MAESAAVVADLVAVGLTAAVVSEVEVVAVALIVAVHFGFEGEGLDFEEVNFDFAKENSDFVAEKEILVVNVDLVEKFDFVLEDLFVEFQDLE